MTILHITVLGSGTSTGVPTIGCRCDVCLSSSSMNKRMRSSILITRDDSGESLVIDTTPDFRMQMLANDVRELNHVLYTHTHADHCHGFDDLRAFYFGPRLPINCWLSKRHTPDFVNRFDYAFKETGYPGIKPNIALHEIPEGGTFEVLGLSIEPIYLEHGHMTVVAFRIGSFAYATDFKKFTAGDIARWKGKITHMVASGLRFREHVSHSTVDQTLDLFEALGVKNGIITHLSHEVDYERDQSRLRGGVKFAFDGMNFKVDSIDSVDSVNTAELPTVIKI